MEMSILVTPHQDPNQNIQNVMKKALNHQIEDQNLSLGDLILDLRNRNPVQDHHTLLLALEEGQGLNQKELAHIQNHQNRDLKDQDQDPEDPGQNQDLDGPVQNRDPEGDQRGQGLNQNLGDQRDQVLTQNLVSPKQPQFHHLKSVLILESVCRKMIHHKNRVMLMMKRLMMVYQFKMMVKKKCHLLWQRSKAMRRRRVKEENLQNQKEIENAVKEGNQDDHVQEADHVPENPQSTLDGEKGITLPQVVLVAAAVKVRHEAQNQPGCQLRKDRGCIHPCLIGNGI